jgi:hypothetical protein
MRNPTDAPRTFALALIVALAALAGCRGASRAERGSHAWDEDDGNVTYSNAAELGVADRAYGFRTATAPEVPAETTTSSLAFVASDVR